MTDIVQEIGNAKKPVFLKGLVEKTHFDSFSMSNFMDKVGSRPVPVEYCLSGIYQPRPEINNGRYFQKMLPFDEALCAITDTCHSAQIHYIPQLNMQALPESIKEELPDLRNQKMQKPYAQALFLGGSGSGTHAHYDLPDNVIVVLAGKKHIALFPPNHLSKLRPFPTLSPCVNMSSLVDDEIMAMHQNLDPQHCPVIEMNQGDALYVPSGWWHRVANFDFTCSVSFLWKPGFSDRLNWSYLRYAFSNSRLGRVLSDR